MVKLNLTRQQGEAIVEAIRAAEKRSSAEIFAVLARRCGDYRLAATAFLLTWVIAISCVFAVLAWRHWITIPLPAFALAQFMAAVTVFVLTHVFPEIAVHFVPRRVRYGHAHASAAQQFLAHGIHHTRGRTGVLVFVSLAERYAEIRADAAIDARLGQDFWNDCVARLTESAGRGDVAAGFVDAIGTIGERLARDFPPRPDDRNELEDRLVIL
jgi:putative membrane protein